MLKKLLLSHTSRLSVASDACVRACVRVRAIFINANITLHQFNEVVTDISTKSGFL